MWTRIALLACVVCLAAPALGHADPLADLHALAASAPKIGDIDHMDAMIDATTPAAAASAPMVSAYAHPEDVSLLASESVVSHLAGQDRELGALNALSQDLATKKHAVELQRQAILADEGKLAKLRRIIAENKEILVRNEQALAKTSKKYLNKVQHYTTQVNQAVVESLKATQDAARTQVESILGQTAVPEAKLDAEDDRAVGLVGARSMLAVDSTADASAAVHAAQMAEARLSAEHAAQFARLVAMKAQSIHQEYARDLAAHKATMPKTHQNDFAHFAEQLKLDQAAESQRTEALRAAMHVEHSAPAQEEKPHAAQQAAAAAAFDASQVARVRAEMAGEPVTMFLEMDESVEMEAEAEAEVEAEAEELGEDYTVLVDLDASMYAEPVPGTPVRTEGLVKPKIEEGVVGLPEEPVAPKKKDLAHLQPCPPGSTLDPTPDTPGKTPEPPVSVPKATPESPDGPYVPPAVPDTPPPSGNGADGAMLEIEAEGDAEVEGEAEGEADADAEAEADVDAEADAEEEF